MKNPLLVALAILPVLFPRLCCAAQIDIAMPATELSAAWQKLNDAQLTNKPKNAIEALDVINARSAAQKNHTTALWAIIAKARVESQSEAYRSAPAHMIRALTRHLEQIGADGGLPPEMRPLLEAALAKAWWDYYQQNRWQLLQRTQTAASPSDDFTTWDARGVLAETGRHFEAALAEPGILQKTPVGDLGILTIPGALSDTYRPTVFDFLAAQAVDFFSAGEQGLPQTEDAFEPDADSPLLGTLDEFIAWRPDAADGGDSTVLRAVRLHQALLRFHANDADGTALADADLRRITWAAKITNATGGTRHIAALETFFKNNEATPLASAACCALAELLKDREPAAARDFALRALALKPSAPVEAICENIRMSIEAPSVQSIATERIWAEPWPEISITYRNHGKIHFAAIPRDWAEEINTGFRTQEERMAALRAVTPAKKWSVDLPATSDFHYRTEKISAPRDLKPGYYYVVASIDENFSTEPGAQNQMALADVWVSNLALVVGPEGFDKAAGHVLNATSGQPVPNATITVWRARRGGAYSAFSETKTDDTGAFSFSLSSRSHRYHFQAVAPDGMSFATGEAIYPDDPPDKVPAHDVVFFFTDRALYRPGQTIRFKGVAIRADVEREKFEILANRSVTVVLSDPNEKEAGRLQLKTNAFGSIAGSFTIPAGRLTGKYRFSPLKMEGADAFVSVEEYKRPKFEVALSAPETAPKLNDVVALTGKAVAYTGAPIDGAKITWRVRRLTRWPSWCWWAQPSAAREIAHGSAAGSQDGSFSIQFNAVPDKTADPKSEPVFNYEVSVDVTDATGETRTARQTVSVGYSAIKAFIYADEWQTADKPVELSLSIKTLSDVHLAAQGTVTIHPLEQPAGIARPELGGHYGNFSSPAREWPEAEPVVTIPFDTTPKNGAAAGGATLAAKLPAGLYRAIVRTQDRFGRPATARADIRVLDLKSTAHKINEPFSVALKSSVVEAGETLTAMWGTGYGDARAFVSIERYGKVLKRFWTPPRRHPTANRIARDRIHARRDCPPCLSSA